MRALRAAACLLLLAAAGAGEVEERWLVGRLNGEPAMNMRFVHRPLDGGGALETIETHLVLGRQLGGGEVATIAVTTVQRQWLDGEGRVHRFHIDEDGAGGTRSIAKGTVEGDVVRVTVFRLGRSRSGEHAVPEGRPLRGWRAEGEALMTLPREEGAVLRGASLELANGRFSLTALDHRFLAAPDDGTLHFRTEFPQMPALASTMVVDGDGAIRSMTMSMGAAMRIDLAPADGPAELADGAVINVARMFEAEGRPRPAGPNRYRLEAEALERIARDGFQRVEDGRLVVADVAAEGELADRDRHLAATAQLELDDPGLRAWVGDHLDGVGDGTAVRAERLRLAVRAHITDKDLANGDASALETFRQRRGDCTEHATLLCAALRIAGLPAKIEYGVVYAPRYGGWIGHSWNSAWLAEQDRWVHLDAAYPGIPRSRYIAIAADAVEGRTTAQALADAIASLIGTTITAESADP